MRVFTRISKQLQEEFNDYREKSKRNISLEAWCLFWLPTFGDFVLNTFTSASPSRLLLDDDYELLFMSAWALNDTMFSARSFYWKGAWAQQVMQNLRSLKQVLFVASFLVEYPAYGFENEHFRIFII